MRRREQEVRRGHDSRGADTDAHVRPSAGGSCIVQRLVVARDVVPDSEEEFITEHYWGYVVQRNGSTREYRVEHPSWRVWRTAAAMLSCDIAGFYGSQYVDALSSSPSSAFVADGSDVSATIGVAGVCRGTLQILLRGR